MTRPTGTNEESTVEGFALRGSTVLSEIDLRGHLASLFQLPNVGVLLGAGASKSAGCKTLSELTESFECRERNDTELGTACETLREKGINLSNIETAWSVLSLVDELSRSAEGLATCKEHAERCRKTLLAVLLEGAIIDPQVATVDTHRKLLQKLILSRQPGQPAPWVFTSNYDLAVELAAEREGITVINGFSGLHTRTFNPSVFDLGWYSTAARGEARFGNTYCYLGKLHGSISWMNRCGHVTEVPWSEVQNSVSEFIEDPVDARQPDCLLCPPSTAKYVDTIGFVQGEMFRRFAEFVERPNTALLVCGYSFNDRHLDRLITGGLRNPTFHLVVSLYGHRIENSRLNPPPVGGLAGLASSHHPNVTWIGDSAADFSQLVEFLPDPALMDEESRRTRMQVRELFRMLEGARGTGATEDGGE